MRTLIDAICPGCGEAHADLWIDTAQPALPWCAACALPLVRSHRYTKAPGVKADSIPGGLYIEHGLCHADGTPRRFDSHSEIAREAKTRSLVNAVEHRPGPDSDRSTLTQRWV